MLRNSQPRTCVTASAALTLFLLFSTMRAVMASGWVDGNPPTYNGVPVHGQCVEFVDAYADAVLHCHIDGIDQYHPYYDPYATDPSHNYNSDGAHWIWDDARLQPHNTDRIANDGSSNFPQSQDIIVWSSNIGGGYGHIAIVDVANSRGDVWVVDANWSLNNDKLGRRHQISINPNILGWFRKKGTSGGSVDPANPYVDGSYSGTQIGTAANPFRTVMQAVNAASATQATIHIKPGTYSEKVSTSKHILFVTWGSGTVRIGG